ncbi:MAG: transketolase [Candidatus Izimaplasma sp.]|nr:transketolase [Candidatus Izimaplasma bacterium]
MNKSINAIRFLGLDAIDKANSGHPGIVLGAAPMMYHLFTKHLRITPDHPNWFNRDRFILSAGHGSAMLYSTLHLSGYDVSIDDLKAFRQLNSNTPGHPEYGHTDGVEATTGPLGQGISMATGMAIGESYLRAKFNKDKLNVIDHFTYALCGDGDLQEGVTQESMSLAGHLGLGKLIVLYDSNDIQLDGPVSSANSEDVKEKYEAMNWHYIKVNNLNDLHNLEEAICIAQGVKDKPSIIEVKTTIGIGSKEAGKSSAHGAPLGKEETAIVRKKLQYDYDLFEAPKEAYADFRENIIKRGNKEVKAWNETLKSYQKEHPELAKQLKAIMDKEDTIDYKSVLKTLKIGTKEATRVSGGRALNALSEEDVSIIGGSADLTKSTKNKGIEGDFGRDNRAARNINFGVREHAMAAITNGLVLHNLKAFAGGFFVFSDYLKPALRIAALMNIPSIFIFTHDSVAVGEDGPTHEPIEQLSMLRTTPNVTVYRPGEANETNYAYRSAFSNQEGPSVIILTRQNVETLVKTTYEDFKKGAYIISDEADFEGILIASGSEVELALKTQKALKKDGINVRVVSMPSMELFNQQTDAYKEKVLPKDSPKRLAIEMGAPGLWYRYAKNVKGITRFGVSAKGEDAKEFFGFTVAEIKKIYKSL